MTLSFLILYVHCANFDVKFNNKDISLKSKSLLFSLK